MEKKIKIEESPVLRFLQDVRHHYLCSDTEQIKMLAPQNEFSDKDIILYQIEEITFDDSDEAPRKEALENVLSAVRLVGVNFLYLIVGSREGVKFYYGLSRTRTEKATERLNMPEIGSNILKASLEGNFRGCKVKELAVEEKNTVLQTMRQMKYASRIEGVAGAIKDNEEFQSVDRLVDVMRGSSFCLLVVAEAIQPQEIVEIEQHLQAAYSSLCAYSKYSVQMGNNVGSTRNESTTEGKNESESETENTSTSQSISTNENKSHSETHGESSSSSKTEGENKGTSKSCSKQGDNKSTTEGGNEGTSKSDTSSKGKSSQHSDSHSEGSSRSNGSSQSQGTSKGTSTSYSKGVSTGTSEGISQAVTKEYLNKCAQEWLKYCDDVLFPRLDYGRGKGLFTSVFYVLSDKKTSQIRLENTALSLYSGKMGNRVPLKAFPIQSAAQRKNMEHCSIPNCMATNPTEIQQKARAFLSQDIRLTKPSKMGNWISTNELSLIAGLPQKEVIGMRLQEQVEFGLNYKKPAKEDGIELGTLIQDGIEVPSSQIYLDKEVLDKHVFIAGVTGSGKTTTCHRILLQSHLPFLVIEPAKTEYRILKNREECKDLLVFTLGNDEAAPFRLNPFQLIPGETITSHVDMMKASLEAAFDMEAAEPQLIETALYRCYESKGWDVNLNSNSQYEDPFAEDADAFPTFTDLLAEVTNVVTEQGFSDRLRGEYIGSIRAMLQSLTLGAKGTMLNTPRSVDIEALLDKQVVLELENIRNGNEKALIMGFVMAAFNEAIRQRFIRTEKEHAHIMLVEEAHRLLSRYQPGDSLNKKQGVETFSDMLAEIRKYGESLIIVDQIPNKMAPDVLKNTNTKIIHRIFAQDDKEAVGNTMALNEDQKRFLSNLGIGQAVVFSDGYKKAMLVQIKNETDTSSQPLRDSCLMKTALSYYTECRWPFFLPVSKNVLELPDAELYPAAKFIVGNVPVLMLQAWKYRKNDTSHHGYNRGYACQWKWIHERGLITTAQIVTWLIQRYAKNKSDGIQAIMKEAFTAFFEAYLKEEKTAVREIEQTEIERINPVKQ